MSLLTVKRRVPTGLALHLEGRSLAPAIWTLDNNPDDVERFMIQANIPCEEWYFDTASGFLHWPRGGIAQVGDWLVEDCGEIKVYSDIDNVRDFYDIQT